MARRSLKGKAPVLPDAVKQQLAQSLVPLRKDEVPVYRGRERQPIVSVLAPGDGRYSSHAIKGVRECARMRNLESETPGALRALKSDLKAYLVFEPVITFDPLEPDQYELKWSKGFHELRMNMLPILQPRNLEVPAGYVAEYPISLETLNDKAYLIVHLSSGSVRDVTPSPANAETTTDAGGAQQTTTNKQKATKAGRKAKKAAPEGETAKTESAATTNAAPETTTVPKTEAAVDGAPAKSPEATGAAAGEPVQA